MGCSISPERERERERERFMKKNADWLAMESCFKDGSCQQVSGSGRPALPFREKGRRAKLQSSEDLRRSMSREELVFAAANRVHEEGSRNAASLLEEVGSPQRRVALVQHTRARSTMDHRNFTAVEALALMIDLDMTRAA